MRRLTTLTTAAALVVLLTAQISAAPDPQPPGDTVSSTSWDGWGRGSMGRQTAYDGITGHYVHFVWRGKAIGTDRHVKYNAYSPSLDIWAWGVGSDGGKIISGFDGGYPTCDVLPSSGALVASWHEQPFPGIDPDWFTRHGIDVNPPLAMLINTTSPPAADEYADNCQHITSGLFESESRYMFPEVESQILSTGEHVVHIIATEVPPEFAELDEEKSVIYYRYVDGVLDQCEGTGEDLGLYIDYSHTHNAIVRSHPDPENDRVAIIYLKPVYERDHPNDICDRLQWQHDVVYIESTDGGATWGPVINVTDYCDGGTLTTDRAMAYSEVSAIYDQHTQKIHIIWTTPLRNESHPCEVVDGTQLWHYTNDGTGPSLVYEASTPEIYCANGPGFYASAISDINIAQCESMFYVSFTHYGFDTSSDGIHVPDCSQGDYPNGDICLTASDDNGETWYADENAPVYDTLTNRGNGLPVRSATVVNITNTYTPECAAGDCHSEIGATMVKYSSEVLHIFYLDDNDAGVYMALEGSETVNFAKYTTYECFSAPSYVVGDPDGSGGIDIDDVVFEIAYIFSGGPPPDPYESGDADCSGAVDIDDVVFLIAYIFSGGPEPGDPDGDGIPDC